MNCPEHLVYRSRCIWVWLYWLDVPRETIPLRVWANPLNYQISLCLGARRVVLNRGGQSVRSWMWRLRQTMKKALAAAKGR